MIPRRFLPSLALFLSGCASTFQGYPSLAKRAIEGAPIAEAAPQPSRSAGAGADPECGPADRAGAGGGAAFDKAWPAADKAAKAASGSAVSSEAWVAAQTALSALESARNDSVSALASLDVLYVERSNAVSEGKVSGGIDMIDAARGTVLAIVDGQNDRLDVLKGRLAQP
ncbi:hypothetical protein [Sphingobium chungbukense]|uniref:Lipoprotein n=1 Tax=Sphingobium chungbukense TaxID=56193 RepID=A0A0M3AL39_9SPHN|nr:hypothetical protein [Sphingobium chungbukense]KKW89666.1 hypothetical protein YP76_24250 [Sphingobium chungbukense]